ncbi:hypothetical protein [Legionella septentrionalis]|uniref:hypothetical protein n=1 Tax=Legionella septentrionalis TaxID=2498109 RepID=UPI000F8CCD14|nr:hypothetical protein [Legionella septentrionalis]RUR08876.1 hypothetical protein ELY14_10275 [Legionella septentrionalis]RUR12290.1 hypothetical protein ELY10_11635 [Legionella septentrionalis]
MPQSTIINLSALAEPQKDSSIPANLLNFVNGNLASQWLSIKAFADLYTQYAPSDGMSSLVCCGIFSAPYSVGWVISKIDWSLISQYKAGKLKTDTFLDKLLDIFSFLKSYNFPEKLKKELFDRRDKLSSLNHTSNIKELTSHIVAKALLEEAWLARMQFDATSSTKVNYFFNENNKNKIYFVANSNEMDINATMRYLTATYPQTKWLNKQTLEHVLQVPETGLKQGISLTSDDSVVLYVSYAHHAFKTGLVHEANVTTDNLLKMLVEQEKLDISKVSLISQWTKDREMATEVLKISKVYDAKDYFCPITQEDSKLKVI